MPSRTYAGFLPAIMRQLPDLDGVLDIGTGDGAFLLDKAGFKNIETRSVLNRYPLHYWLKLLPLPRKLKQEAFTYLRRRHFGNLSIPLPAGNLAVVGYKSV